MRYELGIIGAGNMAEAIVRGVTARGVCGPGQIIAADVSPQRRELFEQTLGIRAVDDNAAVASQSRTILLSVKPYHMQTVLAGIGQATDERTLVISIAAGVSIGQIEKNLGAGKPWRVIRTMPNTPMLVGEGMVALAAGAHASREDLATARKIFEAAATVIEVNEEKLDAVTALSGSGPAYFFYLVEQMTRAGVEMGLSEAESHTLSARTALGAAKMMAASNEPPQELRRKVTTPGGTTEAAIKHMDAQGLPQAIMDALKAARDRSKQLGV